MDIYQKAVHMWAAQKLGVNPDNVKQVLFEAYTESYCETCGTDLAINLEIYLHYPYKGQKFHEISIDGVTPVQMVQECMALVEKDLT